MTMGTGVAVASTFLLSLIATGLMRRYALQKQLLDIPNERSSHTSPMPRGGGVAIVVAFFAALMMLALFGRMDVRVLGALLIGGGGTAVIGLLDDRRPQSAAVRFTVHLAAAACVVILIGGIPKQTLDHWGLSAAWIGGLLAVMALVWVTNLFNFMDGIDGLAAGEAVFIMGAGGLLNWRYGGDVDLTVAMLCLAAASLGFLRWNWPPARIFMGDVGSGFLGFSLTALGLAASQNAPFPIEVWVILGGVFFVDATLTLLRRLMRGEKWLEAHRAHAYQHLARRWKAHLPVTMLAMIINVLWLLPMAILAATFRAYAPWILAAALAPLGALAIACGAGTEQK
jgi:Fuc2NAc and GlcNAc transferase